MGEIFKVEKSSTPLGFTGERFTTAVSGQIELEHLHRYLMARTLCRGKDVVDVASGEGYGTAMLAQVARGIIGVEVDQITVAHAAESYKRPNLRFVCGDARRIPLPDASADVVTSFETLEHFLEHEDFFREVNRILRPEGFLLISTPDCDVYSPSGRPANPFHVRELSRDEFISQLTIHFPAVSVFRQRPLVGSLIAKVSHEPTAGYLITYDKRDEAHYEENTGLARALYLIAIASKAPSINVKTFSSVFIDTDSVDLQAAELEAAKAVAQREIRCLQDSNAAAQSEITQLQGAHAATRNQISELQHAKATALSEVTHLQSLCEGLIAEVSALRASWSWRLTKPIRGLSKRLPLLARLVKSLVHSKRNFQNGRCYVVQNGAAPRIV
jgi:ubiquinone/menaquinone biosynthesis C-methylase UbiE